MPKSAKRIMITVLLLVLLLTLALLLFPGRGSEPKYQGQYLTEWAAQLDRDANPQEKQEAIAAIRAMCSDKIPMLVSWLEYDPSPRHKRVSAALCWLPGRWVRDIEHGILEDPNERRAEVAENVLPVFGPEITPVIPQLTRISNSTNDVVADRAISFAGKLGTNGLAILLPIAANTGNRRQYEALATVTFMAPPRTDAGPAVRVLASFTQSPKADIVSLAAAGLGAWKTDPDVSLPALLPLLSHANTEVRSSAIRAVGAFGDAARSAVPLLVKSLDPFPHARVEATNALLKVAPEILTNAPAQ